MSKCRIIDRLALTKGELKFIDGNNPPEKNPQKTLSALSRLVIDLSIRPNTAKLNVKATNALCADSTLCTT